MNNWRDWDDYPRSTPIRTKGGIKAGNRSGAFGKSWWAKRWIATLESFNIGSRLQRGRSYARQGQVLSIDIQKGAVAAEVQGSRPKPYAVIIQVKVLPDAAWKKVGEALSKQKIFAAKLLGGEMPQDIEQVFSGASVTLFPEKLRDLTTRCSCPDDSNPCKHIAAVYYLLGEEFDRDPFLIFRLRGLDRQELSSLLVSPDHEPTEEVEEPAVRTAPLPVDATAFWQGKPLPDTITAPASPQSVAASLPKRLGAFPFWRGEQPFFEWLEAVYREASQRQTEPRG